MWTWDREIVRPLTLKAAGPATALVERYIDWAAVVDEFVPLRVESDFDARVPDPRVEGRDLATPAVRRCITEAVSTPSSSTPTAIIG